MFKVGLNLPKLDEIVLSREMKKKQRIVKKNNIPLLRLPYFEFENFEKIIKEFLYVNTEVTTKSKEFVAP